MKRPSFQFYPSDWRSDPGVRACSLEERAVWLEILCLMHDSPRRGVLLLPSGEPMSELELSRNLGISYVKTKRICSGIESRGVSSREEKTGALFSRRMVHDEHINQVRSGCGQLGGNPLLVKQNPSKRQANVKQTSKQKPTPSPSSSFPLLKDSSNTETFIPSTKFIDDEKLQETEELHSEPHSETTETKAVEINPLADQISQDGSPRRSQAKSEGKYALTSPEVPLKPKSAQIDPAVAIFESAYAAGNNGAKYPFVKLDGVKISELRVYLNVGTRDIPDGWQQAVGNYFASRDKEGKTIADLCVPLRYNIFRMKQLNEYGKANGNGQYREAVPGSFRGDPTYKPRQR